MAGAAKPTLADLRLELDLGEQAWQRCGDESDALEVAMVLASGQQWVLVRTAADPGGRVLVYSSYEWECFLDGANGGEFDDGSPFGDAAGSLLQNPTRGADQKLGEHGFGKCSGSLGTN